MRAAATCVAAIAVIEIPPKQWDILSLLSNNAMLDDFNVRLASIMTLGFICEDINPEFLSVDDLNLILPAVLNNIFPEQLEITKIALKAFARAAPITDKNF